MPEDTLQPVLTRTVKVIVRHSSDCPNAKSCSAKGCPGGSECKHCNCMKALIVYEGGGSGANRRKSAKTRSWAKAELEAEEIRNSWDPVKQELKRLRAEKESKQARIEEAVDSYLQDMIARLGDNGTVAMARSLFGDVDPETRVVRRNGHLFDWLDTLAPRPLIIGELTTDHLTRWRVYLAKKLDDLTLANRWRMIRGFVNYCKAQGWVADKLGHGLRAPKVKSGARTAVFTDEQYKKILDAVALYDPENLPATTRQAWQQRLLTFVELLRWSAMALVDAVQFRPELVNSDGVLKYHRQKSGMLAVVQLPPHVVELLSEVPLERDSFGREMPFRSKGVKVASDTAKWHRRVVTLFSLAGITEVRTEHGKTRAPHPHMLRDTAAVWMLRHGARLHTVAKALGHSKTATTEKSYLPFVKELEDAFLEDARRALGMP